MLPIREFQSAVSTNRRRIFVVMLVGVVAAFSYMGGLASFRDPIQGYLGNRSGAAWVDGLMGAAMLPTIGLFLAIILVGEQWALRDPRLRCPSCGKNISGMSSLVTATRNCGFCGKRVLAEPVPIE